MKKSLLSVALLLVLSSFSFGQYGEYVEPRLVDEFGGRMGHCDLSARIDALFITLRNNTKAGDERKPEGVIIFYRSTAALPGVADNDTNNLRTIKTHIALRNYDPSSVRFVDGGYKKEELYQVWLVPPGAVDPYPTDALPKPKTPEKGAFLWDRTFVDRKFGILEKAEVIRDHFAQIEDEETEYYDDEAAEMPWENQSFGEFLKNKKRSSGVIIYYLDDRWFDAEKVAAEIEAGKQAIAKESNIDPKRIKVFFGGYRGRVNAEFWIMNKGDQYPSATPEDRPSEDDEPDYGYGEIG